MKISVVIPVGPGRERLLSYTIRGLIEQTLPPDEVILASNKELGPLNLPATSPFNIRAIVEENQKPNTGAVNRNRGVVAARNDFILFIDSEVVLVPDALAIYAQDLTEFPMRVIAGPYHRLGPFGENEEHHIFGAPQINYAGLRHISTEHCLRHVPESGFDERLPWAIVHPQNLYCDYRKCLMLFGGNLIMHREIYQRAGGFWEDLNMGEDGAFGLALCQAGCVWSFEPRALGYHIYHPKERWVDWEPVRVKLMERFHSDNSMVGRMEKDWGWPWELSHAALPNSEFMIMEQWEAKKE